MKRNNLIMLCLIAVGTALTASAQEVKVEKRVIVGPGSPVEIATRKRCSRHKVSNSAEF